MSEQDSDRIQRVATILFVASFAFNLVVVSVRLLDGLPLGVDSTSHLFRVMLMTRSYQENGYFPQWNPYWYGGTTFSLLYPPLAFYIALVPSLLGLGPVLAYKLTDAVFFLIGPIAVYYLCRQFKLDKAESVLAASFFSFSPSVVENYLFYDRFPSTVSLPVVCLFLVVLSRTMQSDHGRLKWNSVIISGALFGGIILLHHLTAFCAALLGLLLVFSEGLGQRRLAPFVRGIALLSIVLSIGAALSSFWSVPFLEASGRFLSNPFYNRNVEFPFVRLSYFSINVVTYEFGLAHFLLSIFGIWVYPVDLKSRRSFVPMVFGMMMVGMTVFELGEKILAEPIRILGQTILILSLVSLTWAIMRRCTSASTHHLHTCYPLAWFAVFFWISLGNSALPFVALSPFSRFWKALDVHRFWLYLTVSMSILSAIGLKKLLRIRVNIPKMRPRVIAALLVGIAVASGCVKAAYTVTHDISEFLPYPLLNSAPPKELVDYFRSDSTYARILALRCPLWIYVLPYYTDKPLVDGWYPQEKLLRRILEIDDYRILDLESSGPVDPADSPNRTKIWKNLISESRMLAIKWVIVGSVSEEVKSELFEGTDFKLDVRFPYQHGTIAVYRASGSVEMIEMISSSPGKAVFERGGTDRFTVRLLEIRGAPTIIVKEAYFPTWYAISDGAPIEVHEDPEGFIVLKPPEGVSEITLQQKPVSPHTYYLSGITLIGILFCLVLIKARARMRRGR